MIERMCGRVSGEAALPRVVFVQMDQHALQNLKKCSHIRSRRINTVLESGGCDFNVECDAWKMY